MRLIHKTWVTEEDVANNLDCAIIFGDNCARKGYGGQAKICRDQPNCVGIVTKWLPSNAEHAFFSDADYDKIIPIIDQDFTKAVEVAYRRRGYYNPMECEGGEQAETTIIITPIGTGLAQLPARAPMVYAYIQSKIDELMRN